MPLHRHYLFNVIQQFNNNDNNVTKGSFKIELKRDEFYLKYKNADFYFLFYYFSSSVKTSMTGY